MSHYLITRLESAPNVSLHFGTSVQELHGDGVLSGIEIGNRQGERTEICARAVFVMIGADPCTSWLRGSVDLDEHGFVKTGFTPGALSPYQTSLPGVFAVGDVRSGSVKRVASAVGEGSVVVQAVHGYLQEVR